MNADTNDFEGRAIPNEGDRLHQLLCAVVLGEASDEERAEVERALATSPELRAEKQRLEATIGLFQGALTDGERLAPIAERELEQALARRRRRPWHAHPGFRIAASFVVFGSAGWIAWRTFEARDVAVRERALPATAAAPEASASKELGKAARTHAPNVEVARLDRDDARELRELGYTGGSNDATPAEAKTDAVLGRAASGERVEFDGGAATTVAPALAAEESERVQEPSNPADRDAFLGDLERSLAENLLKRTEDYSLDSLSGGVFVAQSPSSAETQPYVGTSLGLGARPGTAGEKARSNGPASPGPGAPAAPGSSGTDASGDASRYRYQGAGDSVPPGAPKAEEREAGEAEDSLLLRAALTDATNEEAAKDSSRAAGDDRFERGGQVALFGNEFVVVPDPQTIEARIDALLGGCRRLPNERPRDMYFRVWGDNGYEFPRVDRLSTFSVDVDTASYALARNYLVSGYLPEKAAVRTEEFLNYFKGDVKAPEKGTFAIETEVAPSLFGETSDAWMLRVAIRGKEISKSERTPVALTFVIDVSGSMREGQRLELVKDSLRLLVTQLDARDSVAIVAFSNDATLVLPATSAKNRLAIEQALQPLEPLQSTNTEAGLRLGYEQAFAHLDSNAQNRVVLLTDGVANVGITDPNAMLERVVSQRKAGIYLNTIGVGMQNHNDGLLEQLADRGDGLCNYVDDAAEAKRALVDNFTGAFQPIARDVKVQVEFDPAQVERYRLLGYENRAIADQDFRNDAVDAGEVGAGHQVIALYELVPTASRGDGPLATVRLRWKDPRGEGASEQAHESAHAVTAKSVAGAYAATSPGYRRAVLVAQYAEFLRRSVHANGDSLDRLIEEAQKLARELHDPEFDEFVALVVKSRELIVARLANVDPCDRRLDDLRRIECRRAELEYLSRTGELAELDARRAALEVELRGCLRQRLNGATPDVLRELGYLDGK
ncbi:MAG: von Willebrand factor type A domain-containing protein [Planctomycetes bacterium]|nr:von Willebrand factor type A domain-containing protein [Planctomycetota bacterium]